MPLRPFADLKELSNAGWNVESENRTTDDGRTHVKTVQANIEGKYDVEGGKGQFAAIDHHKQAVTEFDDGNTSLKRNESSSNTAAHEQVVRQTDDGSLFSSTTSSSTKTSKFQEMSSTINDTIPLTTDDYDLTRQSYDNKRNEEMTTSKITNTNDYEQSLRSNSEQGELVSRKVEYPDDNTKVIVETRCLPDGTRVTSTRREFRVPAAQSSRSEHYSQQSKSESKSSSYSSSKLRSDFKDTSTKIIRDTFDDRTDGIVDHQRNIDDNDFKKNHDFERTMKEKDDYEQTYQQRINKKRYESKVDDKQSYVTKIDDKHTYEIKIDDKQKYESKVDEADRREVISKENDQRIVRHDIKDDTQYKKENREVIHHVKNEKQTEEVVERKMSTDRFQTTYQSDYTQKKISSDWSPSHQAWASTLRSDTPTRPSTRASSPGSRTFVSSNSSLRSSVSPDKTYRKPSSRGGSPTKTDRYSPSRSTTEKYSSIDSTHTTTENTTTKQSNNKHHGQSPTRSYSPEKKMSKEHYTRPSVSPERKITNKSPIYRGSPERKNEPKPTIPDSYPGARSSTQPTERNDIVKRPSISPHSKPSYPHDETEYPENISPDRSNGTRPSPRQSPSPNRKSTYERPQKTPLPNKSNLPRKSSLKKPTGDKIQVSPTEQPPSNFQVSPKSDKKDLPQREIDNNYPNKTENTTVKPKPPLERRETYEERCRKILGMMEDASSESKIQETSKQSTEKPDSYLTSPSVSPCHSPEPKENILLSDTKYFGKTTEEKLTASEFIKKEQDSIQITNIIKNQSDILEDSNKKIPKSSTKDEMLKDSEFVKKDTDGKEEEADRIDRLKTSKKCTHRDASVNNETKIKSPSSRDTSPTKKIDKDKPQKISSRDTSPTKKYGTDKLPLRDTSPTKKLDAEKTHKATTKDTVPTKKFDTDRPQKNPPRDTSPSKKFTMDKPKNPSPRDASSTKKLDTKEKTSRDNSPTKIRNVISCTEHAIETKSEEKSTTKTFESDTYNKTVTTEYPLPSEREKSLEKTLKPEELGPKLEYSKIPSTKTPDRPEIRSHHPTYSSTRHTPKMPNKQDIKSDRKPDNKLVGPHSPTASAKISVEKQPKEAISSKHDRPQSPNKKTTSQSPIRKVANDHSKPTQTKEPESVLYATTTKATSNVDETSNYSSEFISSEREKEVLDRVQKSLRKLSPERKESTPSREKSPVKTTTCLRDIDIVTDYAEASEIVEVDQIAESIQKRVITTKDDIIHTEKSKTEKSKDQKVPSKPTSRNVSPTKKAPNVSKTTETTETVTKPRSTSPKKPLSSTERPKSPQIQKTTGIKSKEHVPSQLTRKPSPTKFDKTITSEIKKTGVTKQNSFTKTSTTKTSVTKVSQNNIISRTSDSEVKRTTTPKAPNKDIAMKKETDVKVARTSSDITLKSKKPVSPQKVKSKPEIHVNDMSTLKTNKSNTSRSHKLATKEAQSKLPSKPKSATALNTSLDDDDVLIDVQQAKSSRENSPDRICPTPINFSEDIGTPRFPDEVNEPDDELTKRRHTIIHETESIVDDIVEICEDDELFVKRNEEDHLTESDECLLTVNDKVSKFTSKIHTINKPKETTTRFKETERRLHSDYIDENLKTDECLLSVSEKVNKFAKGPRDTKDNRSPSRNIKDEYDRDTVYQDNYTKLSVNDKAHLFVETAENIKVGKPKVNQKAERPDFSDVDESLKSDDCLLSVSDKVNKFVKTAEQFLSESYEVEEKEKKIKEQHDKIMRKIIDNIDYDSEDESRDIETRDEITKESRAHDEMLNKKTPSSQNKPNDNLVPNNEPTEKTPSKITSLRSSEAVKKAKALFENIASNKQNSKETVYTKVSKTTDSKKITKPDSGTLKKPFDDVNEKTPNINDQDKIKTIPREVSTVESQNNLHQSKRDHEEKQRQSPARLKALSPVPARKNSPGRHLIEEKTTHTTTTQITSKCPSSDRSESPQQKVVDEFADKPHDKIPGYLRPTKTSQLKEEPKVSEETEVSSRRGSGKFGVELRRTSIERSTISSERRRSSVEHHQPCIEDINDLDLLEQMLEKVVGYEQRRRIRAQIRVARKKQESEHMTITKTTKDTTIKRTVSPQRQPRSHTPEYQSRSTPQKSPERETKPYEKLDSPARQSTPQRTISPELESKQKPATKKYASPERQSPHKKSISPDRIKPREPESILLNGHSKEPSKLVTDKRPQSPAKLQQKSTPRSPMRPSSPDKKTRPVSPTKSAAPKPKSNRFSEYASAYMKKIGLKSEEVKSSSPKPKKTPSQQVSENVVKQQRAVEQIDEENQTKQTSTSIAKNVSERTTSKDIIEIVQINGRRSASPEKKISPERRPKSPEKSRSRTPELEKPVEKTPKKKETQTKTVNDNEKKVSSKQQEEEKPSWVTNRNLKKVSSTVRTYSTKKIDNEKQKYRAPSPSKVISKPIDVITSSYGPGPLDADGRPLFGIKALKKGATNYQVKGTVIRQEFHSKNGGEPVGTVSVTAYSTEPEDLEKLLQDQGERPSRIHGLAAITTTKKFGGDSGTTYSEIHNREERAALDQFTHSDRRISESRIDRSSETRYVEDLREKKHSVTEREDNRSFERRHEGRDQERESEYTVEVTREEEERDSTQKHDREQFSETYVMETKREDSRRQQESSDREYRVEVRREERIGRDRETSHADRSGGKIREERVERIQTTQRGESKGKETARTEKRVENKKTVLRQGSVKSLTEKFIKNASDTARSERVTYPKAGLILRTGGVRDPTGDSTHADLSRTDSEHSLGSCDDVVTTSTTTTTQDMGDGVTTTTTSTRTSHGHRQGRSFLDSNTKVTGVQDILTRMKNADIVVEDSDCCEDAEARALLNKFLGASVLMAGMQGYVDEKPGGKVVINQETVQSSGGQVTSSTKVEELDLDQCWDERVLRNLLEECSDYEQRRRLRARIRTLMAEQEACTSAVTEALAAAGDDSEARAGRGGGGGAGGEGGVLAGAGAAVVADVRRALGRLRAALAPPCRHPQAQALLSLAERLEDALDAADRLDGCRRRPRRRSRAARHTVAVTHRDLEEARRIISDPPSPPPPAEPAPRAAADEAPGRADAHVAVSARSRPPPAAHTATIDATRLSHVERRAPPTRKPDFFRHSIADAAQTEPAHRWPESRSGIAAIANKFDSKVENSPPPPLKRAPVRRPPFATQKSPETEEPKRASLYRPLPPTYNFAAPPTDEMSKPLNRFNNSKRARMKRANTIDIGKPLGGYRVDSLEDDDRRAPTVPEFQAKTENDRKFLAFMQKNQENERTPVGGLANWSSRFGNIKNAFESRERSGEQGRSASANSAKKSWVSDEQHNTRPRTFLSDITKDTNRPPWVQRREPPTPTHVSQPSVVKPFIAKPIPVNQFSHAPMSAFKPLKKITSPTSAAPNVWSPPSSNIIKSPTTDNIHEYAFMPKSFVPSPPVPRVPWATDSEKPRKTVGQVASKFQSDKLETYSAPPPKLYSYHPPTPPTHAMSPPTQSYPIKAIPSQNELSAPELVKKIHETNSHRSPAPFPEPIDAQKLQIEFYERQIREKSRRGSMTNGHCEPGDRKPPAPPAPLPTYTIVDYTPPNVTASFVPLQQTPDIEKAKAHKVDYLPDVVMNEVNNYEYAMPARVGPPSPATNKTAPVYQNGAATGLDLDEGTTEHGSVETRVMRGPVRGAATITAGVRTRAADGLRAALDRLAPPPAPAAPAAKLGRLGAPPSPASRASPADGDSVRSASSGSGSRGSSPRPSARRVVGRTKSMHLLAAPKLFEGGIAREQLPDKRRTVEAYFTGRAGAADRMGGMGGRAQGGFALGRSRTMGTVAELQLLDESNADDAFEDLVSALA
ncbi:unnamed protein product, partial [Iphiclides podalirius]